MPTHNPTTHIMQILIDFILVFKYDCQDQIFVKEMRKAT